MTLREKIHATVCPGDQSGYVTECQEFAIVTQGDTLDEVMQNLSEAVSLYLEDEDLSQLQIVAHPSIVVTLPILVSSLIKQRQLIQGIAAKGIKS